MNPVVLPLLFPQHLNQYSDMSHEACFRDSFDKEQYAKFLHNIKLQFLRQAIS